ncbi:MAG: hypothetical protein A3B95_02730 [Candidatus Doudnabacteria bacterium RIFCSPHIGHO2_02_FULL_43_13b]|nr:MAG: hypothetical protein A3B95_02730 [Candidatus Doudnabacteria bacterium RIFCSPHIGHO2_02_FULL_43_13b]
MRNLWLQIKPWFKQIWAGLTSLRNFKRQQIPRLIESFNKKELYTFLISLLVFLLSGGFFLSQAFSDSTKIPYGGEIVEGLVGQPQFINPILSLTNNIDTDLSRIVFSQLLRFDENQTLVPDLAESLPQVSEDQKTFTLKLKPNLKWQDGKPLTAEDIIFTIQTIQNADFESPLRPNWSRVRVEKQDDLTLIFILREVSVSFINNFTFGIIPKHVWENLNPRNFRLSDTNLKPIGSGPFLVRQLRKTADGDITSLTLSPNKYYYQGRPFLDKITFKFFDDYDQLISAYQGREITSLGFLAFSNRAVLTPSEKYSQYQLNLPQYQAVFFNLNKTSPLLEKAVRQALWLTTDRKQIIQEVYSNQAVEAYGPILPNTLGYNEQIEKSVHLSMTEANDILTRAGWILDETTRLRMKNQKPLEFNLVTNGNLVLNAKAAQMLQDQWAQIGVKVNLVVVSAADLEQNYIRPREFDALLFSENVGADPDPFPFWHSSQVRDPGLNLSGFTSNEADKLLTDGRQSSDPAVRTKNYLRFQEIINDQLPAIFLVRSLYIYNVPKKIQGIKLSNVIQPSERFMDINHWYED